MLSLRNLRRGAIVAAAFTLAACGSDKAAGPTTANNEQIIAEMKQALDSGLTGIDQFLGLGAAITGLSAGAPVNPGNLTIDGKSYRFSTTSLTMETRDDETGDITSRTTIVVGWRVTNGDSLFLAVYGPDADEVFTDLRAPIDLAARSGSGAPALAAVSAMLKSGSYTVSKTASLSNGPDQPGLLMVHLGDEILVASAGDGISGGSISYTPASGECSLDDMEESLFGGDAESCELQRSNASFTANTTASSVSGGAEGEGPVVTLPAQTVVGVKLLAPVED
jgi:hypothetical protein